MRPEMSGPVTRPPTIGTIRRLPARPAPISRTGPSSAAMSQKWRRPGAEGMISPFRRKLWRSQRPVDERQVNRTFTVMLGLVPLLSG